MTAFHRLSTTRPIGMGNGPIPWHHIVDYADRLDLDRSNTDALVDIIQEMDGAWLEWQEKQSEGKK